MMFPRPFLMLILTVASLPSLGYSATNPVPSNLPETRLVYSDLNRIKLHCDDLLKTSQQFRGVIRSVRDQVSDAIATTTTIRRLDERMKKLIDQLKPYSAIPKIRTVARSLSKNLQRVRDQLHPLRKKTDECETRILRPTRSKLIAMERTLLTGESRLRQMSQTVSAWMADLNQAVVIAGQVPVARPALEASARAARPLTQQTANAVAATGSLTRDVWRSLNDLHGALTPFHAAGRSADDVNRKLKPADDTIGKIDNVLSKKLTIRNPITRKAVHFRVRDILEKPGDVLDVLLKPLEKLADQLLEPIFKDSKLRLEAPKPLLDLNRQLGSISQLDRQLKQAMTQLERQFGSELERQLQRVQAESTKALKAAKAAALQRARPEQVAPAPPKQAPEPQERSEPAMFIIFG